MKISQYSLLAKATAALLLVTANTAQATPSNITVPLLELLFPPELIVPQKNCPQFPQDCPLSAPENEPVDDDK